MPEQPAPDVSSDELYVGYLPVPSRQRHFLRRVAPLLVMVLIIAGVTWALTFRSPGNAVWDTSGVRTFEGVLYEHPYPMVRIADEAITGGARTMLLVNQGKHGAAVTASGFDGRAVRVRGFTLERADQRLLELETEKIETLSPESGASLYGRLEPTIAKKGSHTLRGEIIDPKCYCGAMKPGEGKTHKECAVLCISGGIPPMFADRSHEPAKLYLLADPRGRAVDERILPYVADDVEITGEIEERGDLTVFKIDPATIRRK
ncbi:MAG TPA: hypothetical protein VJZ71_12850 [Phycisphaerae bacterium]|nr:hypothetical protein [Phycisphaerae bacterium]